MVVVDVDTHLESGPELAAAFCDAVGGSMRHCPELRAMMFAGDLLRALPPDRRPTGEQLYPTNPDEEPWTVRASVKYELPANDDAASRIAWMNDNGIDVALVNFGSSNVGAGVLLSEVPDLQRLSSMTNDFIADRLDGHADRLLQVAVLKDASDIGLGRGRVDAHAGARLPRLFGADQAGQRFRHRAPVVGPLVVGGVRSRDDLRDAHRVHVDVPRRGLGRLGLDVARGCGRRRCAAIPDVGEPAVGPAGAGDDGVRRRVRPSSQPDRPIGGDTGRLAAVVRRPARAPDAAPSGAVHQRVALRPDGWGVHAAQRSSDAAREPGRRHDEPAEGRSPR